MLAEIRAELLVLRKRAAVWVLLVAWLVLDLTFAYLLTVSGYLSGQGRPAVGFATPTRPRRRAARPADDMTRL